jgi:hypothetical protein
MTVPVNGPEDLREWANSKSCGNWRADRSCDHPGCVQAQRAVDVLAAMQEQEAGVWVLRADDVDLTA